MEFFMSGETEEIIGNDFSSIRNAIKSDICKNVLTKNYGSELISISIIPIIARKSILEKGFFKERKLFKRKSQSADMRLQIDFEVFRDADMDKKRLLIIKNIIDCIRILDERAKKDFDGKQLENDILEILEVSVAQLDAL